MNPMKHSSFRSPGTIATILPGVLTEPLTIAAFVLPPLAVYAPLGLAPLFLVVAIVVVVRDGLRSFALIGGLRVLAGLLAVLAAWCVLSASWSILPHHSLFEGLRFLGISIGGLVIMRSAMTLPSEERARVRAAVTAGVVFAVLILLVESLSKAALLRFMVGSHDGHAVQWTHFDRGSTTLVLASWSAFSAALAAGRRRQAAVLMLAVLVVVLLMVSTTAKLAAVFGIIVFAVAWRMPRVVAIVFVVAILAATIVQPVVTPDFRAVASIHQSMPWLKESAIHRLLIWRFVSDRIADRPLLGWGMDSARDLPGGRANLHALAPGTGVPDGSDALPLHPHNAALQWRVELGLPGALLAVAVIAWGLWRISGAQLTPERRAGALAWAGAALLIAVVGYGIWQAWWLCCLWLTAAFYAGAGPGVSSHVAAGCPGAAEPSRASRPA